MQVLDDKNYVAQRDSQDALSFAATQPEQLLHDYRLENKDIDVKITKVVFAGMGGSAIAAEFARTWPILEVPFLVCKNYILPHFVDTETLVIVASFSGNTEETLAVLEEAKVKKAKIAVIAHGGKLLREAKDSEYMVAEVPESLQPRMAVFYMYRALIDIYIAFGLIESSVTTELKGIVERLQQASAAWQQEVPYDKNIAKQFAAHAVGKTLIVYAGPLMYPAAYKWKIDANENAKNTAWCNQYPEFNHNEFLGWSSHPIEKPFAIFDLLSSFEHPRVQKRFALSDRLLSGKRPHAVTIEAQGQSTLEHMLFLVLLGDYVTLYLAILNNVNPAPVDLVEKFKVELNN